MTTATITLDRLAEACRAADDGSDAAGNFETYWHERGVDPSDLAYVAKQRALRAVLIERGVDPNVSAPTGVRLTRDEQLRQLAYAAVWMDGFAASNVLDNAAGEATC